MELINIKKWNSSELEAKFTQQMRISAKAVESGDTGFKLLSVKNHPGH